MVFQNDMLPIPYHLLIVAFLLGFLSFRAIHKNASRFLACNQIRFRCTSVESVYQVFLWMLGYHKHRENTTKMSHPRFVHTVAKVGELHHALRAKTRPKSRSMKCMQGAKGTYIYGYLHQRMNNRDQCFQSI